MNTIFRGEVAKAISAKFTKSWGKNQEIYYGNIYKNNVKFGRDL